MKGTPLKWAQKQNSLLWLKANIRQRIRVRWICLLSLKQRFLVFYAFDRYSLFVLKKRTHAVQIHVCLELVTKPHPQHIHVLASEDTGASPVIHVNNFSVTFECATSLSSGWKAYRKVAHKISDILLSPKLW